MGGRRSRSVSWIVIPVVVTMLVGAALTVDSPPAQAKKDKAVVACPKKVGGLKLERVSAYDRRQTCDYVRFGKNYGKLVLGIDWAPDAQGERSWCESRRPEPAAAESYSNPSLRLDSASTKVFATASWTEGAVSTKQAAKLLRKAIAAAEPLGHPCVPPVEPMASDGLSCPPLLPSGLVRADWVDEEPYAIESMDDIIGGRFSLKCHYRPPYKDEWPSPAMGGSLLVTVRWNEGPPGSSTLCLAKVDQGAGQTETRFGYHPVSVEIGDEFVDRWGGQALADGLAAAAAARTSPCPGAPAGPAPYEGATTTGPGTTTIVLGGGPDDELPAIGAITAVPEDDRHRIVIGGLDGEVIREEFLGDRAEIVGFGPVARDADGNWSVSVEVELGTAPAPTNAPAPSPAPATPEPTVVPAVTAAPTAEPAVTAAPTPAPAVPAVSTPAPSATPAVRPSPEPASSPTPVPPPELVGMPEAVTDYIAGLEPEAAGAVRNLTDHLVVLGDEIVVEGKGEVTIPASDLAELQRLVPDLVNEVRPVSGSILVDGPIDVLVTPVIGDDGLIEFRTNRLQDQIRAHAIVKALVVALNNYVAESGGRFRTISVTPEGLTVTAEKRAPGSGGG